MKLKTAYSFVFLFLLSLPLMAQPADSLRRKTNPAAKREFKAQRAVLFRFNYSALIPAADLAKRFGAFSNLGGSVGIKFENGWDIRAEGGALFGRNVNEYSIVDSLRSSDGYLIDQNGYNFTPVLSIRGFNAGLHVGKLFAVGRNRNSGIFVSLGAGFLQHRIHFQGRGTSPQLSGDYLKGYDRLTNGFAMYQFVGYQYMSIKKLVNFFVGFDFAQGYTQYARNWQNDLRRPDNTKRSDNYWGLRIGWILPLYTANKGEDEFIFR